VVDPASGAGIDEALVTVMPGPGSYTGEDLVEISCHGSPVLLERIVEILVSSGARLAQAGEFTRRAFLSGRIDLAQAEAVALLISAGSARGAELAARHVTGALSARVRQIREAVLGVMAGLEVALDFPEDEVGLSSATAGSEVSEISGELSRLTDGARRGRWVHQGVSVMLVGAPNVGKSSLLNALLGRKRAIVSPVPGTTRDLLEASVSIGGVQVRLMDGAGIGTPADEVDAEGMRRSVEAAGQCDLLVVVLDGSRPASDRDDEVLAMSPQSDRLVVLNKCDLPPARSGHPGAISCSALTGMGVADVMTGIESWLGKRSAVAGEEDEVIASLRLIGHLEDARAALDRAVSAFDSGLAAEAALVDLRLAVRCLDEALGIESGDEVLDLVFSTFCVGK
jgi:tRNA modification GTPase